VKNDQSGKDLIEDALLQPRAQTGTAMGTAMGTVSSEENRHARVHEVHEAHAHKILCNALEKTLLRDKVSSGDSVTDSVTDTVTDTDTVTVTWMLIGLDGRMSKLCTHTSCASSDTISSTVSKLNVLAADFDVGSICALVHRNCDRDRDANV
jgi:hypothetical protein